MVSKKILFISLFFLLISTFTVQAENKSNKNPQHFSKVMVIIFENMSYAEIKNAPTFKKLVEYSGHSRDKNGHLTKLTKLEALQDSDGVGYAFLSRYFNNHSGGNEPTRPSQPNYIALTSGSIQNIKDNDIHNLDVDHLANELNEANVTWKVYADDFPDPKGSHISAIPKKSTPVTIKPFHRDPQKSEAENDLAEEQYLATFKKDHHIYDENHLGYNPQSGCFIGAFHKDNGNPEDGYARKHEPFISYLSVQNDFQQCKKILNSSRLTNDIRSMPSVSFYIPNQVNDGHNGEFHNRVINANRFLSKLLGRDPKTGELLPEATDAPLRQFMENDGLLVITFDEPSLEGNPDNSIYTLLAGKMIHSGAYPNAEGKNAPICYPNRNKQSKDIQGFYESTHCNHYNLLKLIEANWALRGLDDTHTSIGYKQAYPLDNNIPHLWKS